MKTAQPKRAKRPRLDDQRGPKRQRSLQISGTGARVAATDSPLSHRCVLAASPGGAGTMAPAAAKPTMSTGRSSDDPIFAAIEAHRQAVTKRFAGERGAVGKDVYENAVAHESEMLAELFETAPTTFAGLLAFFQHLSWPLPGADKTVIDDMISMWEHDDWEPDATQWAVLMELALRRIAVRS